MTISVFDKTHGFSSTANWFGDRVKTFTLTFSLYLCMNTFSWINLWRFEIIWVLCTELWMWKSIGLPSIYNPLSESAQTPTLTSWCQQQFDLKIKALEIVEKSKQSCKMAIHVIWKLYTYMYMYYYHDIDNPKKCIQHLVKPTYCLHLKPPKRIVRTCNGSTAHRAAQMHLHLEILTTGKYFWDD